MYSFFINATATAGIKTKLNTLSLHDALPISDMDGEKVYLQTPDAEMNYTSIDSTTVKEGSFTFKGEDEKVVIARIFYDKKSDNVSAPFNVVLQKGKIKVKIDSESFIEGTPLNDSLQVVVTDDLLRSDDAIKFVENNKDNIVGAYVLSRILYKTTEAELETITKGASGSFKTSVYNGLIDKYMEGLKRSSVGATYTNLKMQDPEGKDVELSQYIGKGKYVLVDFWATWCGPCRREMPALVEIYKEYKDKGFEIVGVSFDRNATSWKKGIEDLDITWPQMSDLKGWQCEASSVYAIRSIPQTLLINPDGKIIAKNLTTEELSEELKKLLK